MYKEVLECLTAARTLVESLEVLLRTASGSEENVGTSVPGGAASNAVNTGLPRPSTGPMIKRGNRWQVRYGSINAAALEWLNTTGEKEVHIGELLKMVKRRNSALLRLSRASLEGCLSRHIRKFGDDSLIVRVAPGVYAARERTRQ